MNFGDIKPLSERQSCDPVSYRECYFVGSDAVIETPIYDEGALQAGISINGPAIVTTAATTYLVEPGWNFHASNYGAVWITQIQAH